MSSSSSLIFVFLLFTALPSTSIAHDYSGALKKCLLFFEAQRSGHLPPNQRVRWRSNSGLNDGKASGVNLVGGYYDAGDNVKFGLPMAFTVTMLSWSIIEYRTQMAAIGELHHAMEAVKWGTDYFIKAHPEPYVLYGEVGDGDSDHSCWQRPEDMTTDRRAYKIDVNNPGSDLAGETAAAMAAASLVFRRSSPVYANELLLHAKQLFSFADARQGKYDSSITVARGFYNSVSGYGDELLWAAAWLYKATKDHRYLDYLSTNGESLGGTSWSMTEFGWDVKYVGVQVLVSKILMEGEAGGAHNTEELELYQEKAEAFMCSCVGKGTRSIQKTPGGLFFWQSWNNMQFVSGASFLLTVYSDYLKKSGKMVISCGQQQEVEAMELLETAKSQVDYILGNNPRGTSYLVGYGSSYPLRVHHRGSSIVSINVNSSFISCKQGYSEWYKREQSDPNVLIGALVGGPGREDEFTDRRDNYEQTEPATYSTASLVGILARLSGGSSHASRNELVVANVASAIVVKQRAGKSWRWKRQVYTKYVGKMWNRSNKVVNHVKVEIEGLSGPLFGLALAEKGKNVYGFPFWVNSLGVGKSIEFVYFQVGPAANVTVLVGERRGVISGEGGEKEERRD